MRRLGLIVGWVLLGVVLSLLSLAVTTTYTGVFGNVCGENEDELCYQEMPQWGFPLPFLKDAGGVSVMGVRGIEDDFLGWAFGLDVGFYLLAVGGVYLLAFQKNKLRQLAGALKRELAVYRRVMADERTPRLARVLLWLAVGYLLLPFDLVPDAIPVLGQLDDLLIVPGLFWLALRMIPEEVIRDAREYNSGQGKDNDKLPGSDRP